MRLLTNLLLPNRCHNPSVHQIRVLHGLVLNDFLLPCNGSPNVSTCQSRAWLGQLYLKPLPPHYNFDRKRKTEAQHHNQCRQMVEYLIYNSINRICTDKTLDLPSCHGLQSLQVMIHERTLSTRKRRFRNLETLQNRVKWTNSEKWNAIVQLVTTVNGGVTPPDRNHI